MNPNLTLLTALLLASLAALHAADAPKLLPPGWDPALAGDVVMQRLVKVTAPQAKGAHDAEFVCVGDRAYIVEHDNDVAPGHGAGAAMNCVLTVVNLKTLRVEKTHLLAKAGQAFANVTLADAQVFVPRIIRKDQHTLRTYFCSQPAKEQAMTWYRDFDLRTQTFAGSLHKAKLRTARIPSSPFCLELLRAAGVPLTSTSANPAGAEPPRTVAAILEALGDGVELSVDAGELPPSLPSTVVSVTGPRPRLLRAGSVPARRISAVVDLDLELPA